VDQVAEMMRQLGGEPVAVAVGGILVADGRYGTLVSGALAKLLSGLRQDIAATSVDLVAQNLLIEIAATMQKHLMAVESGR
jgi:DNA-binding ferritin-like protein